MTDKGHYRSLTVVTFAITIHSCWLYLLEAPACDIPCPQGSWPATQYHLQIQSDNVRYTSYKFCLDTIYIIIYIDYIGYPHFCWNWYALMQWFHGTFQSFVSFKFGLSRHARSTRNQQPSRNSCANGTHDVHPSLLFVVGFGG